MGPHRRFCRDMPLARAGGKYATGTFKEIHRLRMCHSLWRSILEFARRANRPTGRARGMSLRSVVCINKEAKNSGFSFHDDDNLTLHRFLFKMIMHFLYRTPLVFLKHFCQLPAYAALAVAAEVLNEVLQRF